MVDIGFSRSDATKATGEGFDIGEDMAEEQSETVHNMAARPGQGLTCFSFV